MEDSEKSLQAERERDRAELKVWRAARLAAAKKEDIRELDARRNQQDDSWE